MNLENILKKHDLIKAHQKFIIYNIKKIYRYEIIK